jgi:hypothetical protein
MAGGQARGLRRPPIRFREGGYRVNRGSTRDSLRSAAVAFRLRSRDHPSWASVALNKAQPISPPSATSNRQMTLKPRSALTLTGVFIVLTAAACNEADPAQWMLQVDTLRSDGAVRLATTLEVLGKEGLKGDPRDQPVRLRFECRRGTGAFAAVLTPRTLGSGSASLGISLDSRPPYSVSAVSGTFGEWGMVYISEWSALLDSLRRHRSMLVEYSSVQTQRTVAEFSVVGIDSFRPRFLEACAKR